MNAVHAQPIRQIVKFGIDNLIDLKFEPLKGKKIALLTNVASRTRFLEETAQVLSSTNKIELCALLTPEHGYFGAIPAGAPVQGEIIYGIPTYSLYGKVRRPTKQMIGSCDAVVVDLQDIGLRPYTFVSTMFNVMDACAEYKIPIFILDRPNPLGGITVDGNTLELSVRSFLGVAPIPYMHGMTIGELALMINEEGWLPQSTAGIARKCTLSVLKMKRWRRNMQWEDTQAPWIPTSPNIPSVNAIRGAAITGVVGELNLLSIGIGTALPFQYLGMPGLKTDLITQKCILLKEYDVHAMQTRFKPTSGKYANQTCDGIMFALQPNPNIKLFSAGIELMLGIRKVYPWIFSDSLANTSVEKKTTFIKVTGNNELYSLWTNPSTTDDQIRAATSKGCSEFIAKREKYLLYK